MVYKMAEYLRLRGSEALAPVLAVKLCSVVWSGRPMGNSEPVALVPLQDHRDEEAVIALSAGSGIEKAKVLPLPRSLVAQILPP